jgi:hypothetical protein
MVRISRRRPRVLFGAAAISALFLGMTGVSTASAASSAGAAARGTSGVSASRVIHSGSAVGIYEWFLNNGGGYNDDGQITLSSNHSWADAVLTDNGSWLQSGTTIALSDLVAGGGTFIGTVGRHGLSSRKTPGHFVFPSGTSGTWYAVKV